MNKGVRSQFKSPFRAVKKSGDKLSLQTEVEKLQKKCKELDKQIEELEQEGHFKEEELDVHIKKLHEYNDVKDIGQMLLGRIVLFIFDRVIAFMVATKEGVTTKDLYSRFNLDLDD